jgi:putative ABC transport system permease protein
MRDFTNPTMRPWEFGATMFVAFGVLALALAAIGLYSVIAFGVTQRTHELGVRIALGAEVGDVLRLVVGEGVRLTIVGVVLGGAIALAAGRWTSPLLFQVSPKDPLVYAVVTLTLTVVGVLASAIPAARATRVDPNIALRAE